MKKVVVTLLLIAAPVIAHAAIGSTYNTYLSDPNLNSSVQNPSPGQLQGGISGGQIKYIPLEAFTPEEASRGFGGWGGLSFTDYIANTYRTLITLGSILAVVLLTLGGVRYMLGEATHQLDKAKKQMWAAIIGLLVIVGSFLILYTLNPDLLKFNLNITSSNTQTLPPSTVSNNNLYANYAQQQDKYTQNINGPHSAQECNDSIKWLKDNGAYSPNFSGARTDQMSQLKCGTPAASDKILCAQLSNEVSDKFTIAFSNACSQYR